MFILIRTCKYLISIMIISIYTQGFALTVHSPDCPLVISVQQQLKNTPKGWTGFNQETQYFLDGVSFYSGDPKELASLKPDVLTSRHAKWSFSPQDNIYILCEYNQTVMSLTRKLPTGVLECEVTYQSQVKGNKGPLPDRISCHL